MGLRLRLLRSALLTEHVEVDGQQLRIPPGVLNPVLFRSGAWFGRQIAQRVSSGQRLLDLGCGCGVVGVLSRRSGARVIAVDIDRRAVRAARLNGLTDARQGDLFAPVHAMRFDLICFNPPYFRGRPRLRRYGRALYGGRRLEVLGRFLDQLEAHLTPTGRGWMVLSDRAPAALRRAERAGWGVKCVESIEGEVLSLWSSPQMG